METADMKIRRIHTRKWAWVMILILLMPVCEALCDTHGTVTQQHVIWTSQNWLLLLAMGMLGFAKAPGIVSHRLVKNILGWLRWI